MTDHDGALLDRDMGLLLAAASRAVISLYRPLLKPYHLTHPQYLVCSPCTSTTRVARAI